MLGRCRLKRDKNLVVQVTKVRTDLTGGNEEEVSRLRMGRASNSLCRDYEIRLSLQRGRTRVMCSKSYNSVLNFKKTMVTK